MLHISLDHKKKRSYARQIYSQAREQILGGTWEGGMALPSTRVLAKELQIARNTVLTAYDMLLSEGLIYSRPGSGVFVNEGITAPKLTETVAAYHVPSLSGRRLEEGTLNFDSGMPALDLFPRKKWNQTLSRAFLEAPVSALGYDDPQGRGELREELCAYLRKARGILCSPEEILITAGTKQGLTLVAKGLLDARSEVWIESPTNDNVRQIFSYHTQKIIPFEVDEEGIQVKDFPLEGSPDLIFVTPAHQFPMGGVMSLSRRAQLVDFAANRGCLLLEDDYDSEFRYDCVPSTCLYELGRDQVIHLGTFSKVLFPSLRLGYLVAPQSVIKKLREDKRLMDHHSNSISQLALAQFIRSGDLERHCHRMKKVYHKRREVLLALLEEIFPGQVTVQGEAAGMHVIAGFSGVQFQETHMERLLERGVYMVPVERHALIPGRHRHQLILGYAQLSEEEMRRGLLILKEVLAQNTAR